MRNVLENKTILITGGTGSFGNKVAKFLKKYNPSSIMIFSRDEKKQYEMNAREPDFNYVIGDIRDYNRLKQVMRNVDYIFHAAALKQVPSCEIHPMEAVKTNIIGSDNVCNVAIESGVKSVVGLSTDKAVKPVNAMGISKSMMEKIVTSKNIDTNINTVFSCVRYGNVIGSRGSVIPLFYNQIANKEFVTVTVPEMTRFLMSLDDSVDLVYHALSNAQGGEIFVKKSPACTVIDLAKAMVKKYGDGDEDRIKVVGIRAGEKIDEVLVNEYEINRSIESDQFHAIYPEYKQIESNTKYELGYEYTSKNTEQITDYNQIAELVEVAMGDQFYS